MHVCYAEHRRGTHAANSLAQDTNAVIRTVAKEFGLSTDDHMVQSIRAAMLVTPKGHVTLFPGAQDLLQQIKAWGLRCVAVSNATWRDGVAYQRDFEDVGIGHLVDAVVSSVDVDFHKPHPAMFEAALVAAGCLPPECVMIGHSELKDIQPALGLRTILVAINQPQPNASAAHAVVASLPGVAHILRAWMGPPRHSQVAPF